jgi:predicted HTH transcriptional regulator
VTLENLLVADPRSRNPLLADIIKRIGLAERTGRGIDRIFEGMLRYGRPAPDYSMSNAFTVSVHMANVTADLNFLKMVVEQEEKGMPEYQQLMSQCFHNYFMPLKPGRWMTVDLHNSKNSVWVSETIPSFCLQKWKS